MIIFLTIFFIILILFIIAYIFYFKEVRNELNERYLDVWKNKNSEVNEYDKMMGKYGFFVDMETKDVKLPYQMLKDVDLDQSVLQYLEDETIIEPDIDEYIYNQLRFYNFKFKPNNYNVYNSIHVNKNMLINTTQFNDKKNHKELIRELNGLNNFLRVKENLNRLTLSEEEYNKFRQYMDDIYEIKIKQIANQSHATQSHISYLNQLEHEINKLKKF